MKSKTPAYVYVVLNEDGFTCGAVPTRKMARGCAKRYRECNPGERFRIIKYVLGA